MRYRRLPIAGQSYFFTVVTAERRPVFADPDMVGLLRRTVRDVRRTHPFTIQAAVILPDHLHMIWEMPEHDGDFPMRWRLIKRAFSRQCGLPPATSPERSARGYRGVWQHRYWEHRIRDAADFENHVNYIHMNPVKHGYCADPADWPHSSFRRFMAVGLGGPD